MFREIVLASQYVYVLPVKDYRSALSLCLNLFLVKVFTPLPKSSSLGKHDALPSFQLYARIIIMGGGERTSDSTRLFRRGTSPPTNTCFEQLTLQLVPAKWGLQRPHSRAQRDCAEHARVEPIHVHTSHGSCLPVSSHFAQLSVGAALFQLFTSI
jgi:hypothetical protein